MKREVSWIPIWNDKRPGSGLEHLLLSDGTADSIVLAFDEDGRPFRLAYQLSWEADWRLRRAHLEVTTAAGTRSLALQTDGHGHWRDGDGAALSALDGCIDIDIWPTPFTNTFPIRRESLVVGTSGEYVMAWVAAPALTVEPKPQRYTRIAERRYVYESLDSAFRAELQVDDDGLVLDYEGVFRRVV